MQHDTLGGSQATDDLYPRVIVLTDGDAAEPGDFMFDDKHGPMLALAKQR